jgi:hypothetical protein
MLNLPEKMYRAWTAFWAAGIIMLIWISVETVVPGYISFLQPFIAVYGIVVISLILPPNVSRYYKH